MDEKKCSRVRRREEKVEKEEDKSCRSKMLESEETDKTMRSSMMLGEEDNGNNGNTTLEQEEGNLRLGPETAFLAEGSVHDTGGMVEWAGTVRDHQRWNYQILYYNK